MFTWNGKVFLVARRDLNGPYDWAPTWLPFTIWKFMNLVSYSLRSHTTSIWMVDRDTMELKFLTDIYGCGDTAFPSIVQVTENRFTIANYASPLKNSWWPWIVGQIFPT
jgi:hypothetical protein